MLFKELQEVDRYGIFNDYVSVKDAKIQGVIPKEYDSIVPDLCVCGSENMITRNRTTLTCCDFNCPEKMAYAMTEMFRRYGFKELGISTCRTIVNYCLESGDFEIPTHTEVIKLKPDSDLRFRLGAKWDLLLYYIDVMKEKEYSFGDLVYYSTIPEFGKESLSLFSTISSIVDIAKLLEEDKLFEFFNERGVKSVYRIEIFKEYLLSVYVLEKYINHPLLKPGLSTRKVCITGSLSIDGVGVTRDQFIAYCNELGLFHGLRMFKVVNTDAKKTCQIIADYPTNNAKYLAGLERQNYGEVDAIISGQEYIDRLRKEVASWEKILEETESQMN